MCDSTEMVSDIKSALEIDVCNLNIANLKSLMLSKPSRGSKVDVSTCKFCVMIFI